MYANLPQKPGSLVPPLFRTLETLLNVFWFFMFISDDFFAAAQEIPSYVSEVCSFDTLVYPQVVFVWEVYLTTTVHSPNRTKKAQQSEHFMQTYLIKHKLILFYHASRSQYIISWGWTKTVWFTIRSKCFFLKVPPSTLPLLLYS